MRSLVPIALSVAAAAAAPLGACAEETKPPATAPPPDEAAERAAEAALEAELAAEHPGSSLAVGPARRGHPAVAIDVGWVRSGLRFDLGITHRVDLVVRAEAMLLYDALGGQNGLSAGLRWTPFVWQRARLGGEVTVGQLYSSTDAERGTNTVFRGELAAGLHLGPAIAYARGAVRAIRTSPVAGASTFNDQELGFGIEARRSRVIAGGEWYLIARPRLDTLSQWRVRLGLAL